MVPNLLNENDKCEKPSKLEAETSHHISTTEEGPYMMADVGNIVANSQPLCPPCTYETIGSAQPSSAITQKVGYTVILTLMLY